MKKSTKSKRAIKSYIDGEIRTNLAGFEYVIIDERYDRVLHKREFRVRFLSSGYETDWVNSSMIISNTIKDPYSPIIQGFACIGIISDEIKSKPYYHQLYNVWYHMLKRCYDPSDTNYKRYGALGVRVDSRWFCFENFIYDAQYLPGFERLVNGENMHLDKDLKQYNLPHSMRVYSRNTCVFLPATLNVALPLITRYNEIYNNPLKIMTREDYDYYKSCMSAVEMCRIVK